VGLESDLLFSRDGLYFAAGVAFMYMDVLMVLNFAVDLLLLIAANRLCGYPASVKRSVPAAVLGGVYGGVCAVPGLVFLGRFWGRVLCLLVMSGIAFGFCRNALRRTVLFVFLTMALGGVALGVNNRSFLGILLCAVVVAVMCLIGFHGKVGAEYIPVVIGQGKQTLRFFALRDTGNTLTDPVSGEQVLVASAELGKRLLGVSEAELQNPVEAMERLSGARLIPYHSVGREGGLLLARRFEDVTIGSRKGSCLVAFVPHEIGKGEPYEALTGGA
jgi:stage II sporulation protein GA (sporulation sigma-E factor processing peptidase)